jgi:hypothetical protein
MADVEASQMGLSSDLAGRSLQDELHFIGEHYMFKIFGF